MSFASNIGKALGSALNIGSRYVAQKSANGISAAAQTAQGAFNQRSVDNANSINQANMNSQWQWNAAMAQMTNDYNTMMWEKAAEWNEMMWQKQADFNHKEAQINRDWQERMANTAYQRGISDMKAAGLNPALAMGGLQTATPSGGAATVSAANMGAASGATASGSLLGADAANVSSYQGKMDNMAALFGLLGTALSSISNAQSALGGLGKLGEGLGEAMKYAFTDTGREEFKEDFENAWKKGREYQKNPTYKANPRNGIDWNMKNNSWYHGGSSGSY